MHGQPGAVFARGGNDLKECRGKSKRRAAARTIKLMTVTGKWHSRSSRSSSRARTAAVDDVLRSGGLLGLGRYLALGFRTELKSIGVALEFLAEIWSLSGLFS